MTKGLLVSRKNKMLLHKLCISDPSVENVNNYKCYRNLYNKLLRASKTMYYECSFEKFKKTQKKSWDLLKEVSVGQSNPQKVSKITVNGEEITDNQKMAEEFNNFFSKVGKEISDSVPLTNVTPESYLDNDLNAPLFTMGLTGPSHICDTIKAFTNKTSLDLDGISTNFL
jgi:hypothetical protein